MLPLTDGEYRAEFNRLYAIRDDGDRGFMLRTAVQEAHILRLERDALQRESDRAKQVVRDGWSEHMHSFEFMECDETWLLQWANYRP